MKGAALHVKARVWIWVWLAIALAAFGVSRAIPDLLQMPSGLSLPTLVTLIAGILALSNLLVLVTAFSFGRVKRPAVEASMVGRLYRLAAVVAIGLSIAYAFGELASFGSFFAMFGGMLLGWSLQAPVSGFAAWLLVSLKRPFRPSDRVQFPNLGLTGDVHDIGPMYTVLNQVGGTIGSEEAVGRYILVPNAMLFSQVVINYTVTQEAAYMLDECVIRITHDSDWAEAERILLEAANEVTADIIQATGVEPYIRSDLYDYGVYLRLRFQTRVKDRPKIAYEITKRIFQSFQSGTSVDFAIPYVYSYRAGSTRKDEANVQSRDKEVQQVRDIDIARIAPTHMPPFDDHDVEQLVESIAERGLLQPVVLLKHPEKDSYDIVAGHLRYEACKRLGWTSVPALVRRVDPS